MPAGHLRRSLVAVLIGVAVPAAAAPAAGLTDPTGDPATSEVTPAPVSLRPFADIVEFDAALSGSTVELRVRVAADGPPPTSFLAGIGVDTTPGDMYRQHSHQPGQHQVDGEVGDDVPLLGIDA